MEASDFYERTEVIHEVAEAKRSKISYCLIADIAAKSLRRKKGMFLDIGCGDGSLALRFKDCYEIIGVDISQRAVALANEAGIDARRVDVSFEVLPFGDGYFDLVYMGDVIEHLLNPDFAISEVFRVTRSKGFLVMSTPNLASWLNRLLLLSGMQPLFSEVSTARHFGRPTQQSFTPVGHLRLFTCRALTEFLTYYGFRIVRLEGAPHEGLPVFLRQSDKIVSQIPSLASSIIVVAQKSR